MEDPRSLTSAIGHHRTLRDLVDTYVRDYLPTKAFNTSNTERGFFQRVAQELGSIPLDKCSPLVLNSWLDRFRATHKPNSIRRYWVALAALFTCAVRDLEWLERSPMRRVRRPPAPPSRERCLSEDELARLLKACQQSRNMNLYPMVMLALSTGARKNELRERTWEELDLERGLLLLRQTKNGTRRAVPLVGPVVTLLRGHALMRPSKYVFPRADGLKPVNITSAWTYARARAGLGDFRFHDLRHTAASYLVMNGASLRDVAEILGHKSLEQTKRYTHLVEPYTRGLLERMTQQRLFGGTPPCL
jgi:integrase